ncbi:MAG: transporter [Gemmataceae bacterium]|nr:transporter [Gemmataceae bacterium]
MTPDLEALAEQIADLDRADRRFDWSAVRRIKNQYTLFNPTPRPLRREFITDRPDKTINPVTVDAGHVQVETDLVTATFDRRQPRQYAFAGQPPKTGTGGFFQQQPFIPGDKDDYVFLLTNVRVGLTNNAEVQVFLRPFQRLTTPAGFGQPAANAFGFGDMRVLFKENLWGNEGGPTAFALTQYLDIPAGRPDLSTGAVEGGATGTLLFRFPGKTYLGMETGLEWRKDIFAGRYHVEVPASISLAYSFTKELSAKAEFASQFSAEPGAQWVGVVALAVLYGLSDDVQFDIGINIGVTPAANDWNPYIGLAKRF